MLVCLLIGVLAIYVWYLLSSTHSHSVARHHGQMFVLRCRRQNNDWLLMSTREESHVFASSMGFCAVEERRCRAVGRCGRAVGRYGFASSMGFLAMAGRRCRTVGRCCNNPSGRGHQRDSSSAGTGNSSGGSGRSSDPKGSTHIESNPTGHGSGSLGDIVVLEVCCYTLTRCFIVRSLLGKTECRRQSVQD